MKAKYQPSEKVLYRGRKATIATSGEENIRYGIECENGDWYMVGEDELARKTEHETT